MLKTKNERLTVTGMLIAVGIILPFATSHGLGMSGNVLLPMHIPVLLCGLLCGASYGAICGIILPLLNSALTGMPPLYPMLPIMTFELMTYGLISGLMFNNTRLGKIRLGVYPSLLTAMICGRIIYGLVFAILFFINRDLKALSAWGAVITGIPGIIIQLILIPCIVEAVGHGMRGGRKNAVQSAINLICEDTAVCVVIKDNTIIKTEYGSGIGPIIKMYESGILKDAFVVDKIIGKASAMILTLGGVKGCYGITVSRAAADWLKAHNTDVSYKECVELIANRTGDGICPMEQTVLDIDNEEAALSAVKRKLEELKAHVK